MKRSVVVLIVGFVFLRFGAKGQVKEQDTNQQKRAVKGMVSDTLKNGVPGAGIYLVTGKDTLKTSSNMDGAFSFAEVGGKSFVLLVKGMGYVPYAGRFDFRGSTGPEFLLGPVVLKEQARQLKEVVIKADEPVRVMKDTVEYNAGSYVVREQDMLEDLLKQLPGVEVDRDGNVSSMGKPMTKLRVNGKDFFTSNVKDFIRQLPAGIISKLQVIEDYGDRANFTGIKVGEPQKMLNLVIKKGKSKGYFGDVATSGGTDERYELKGNTNIWLDTKQIGATAGVNNTNTGSGISNTGKGDLNFRDSWGKGLAVNGSYRYEDSRNRSTSESYMESISSLGTLYNRMHSESLNRSRVNNLFWNMQYTGKQDFIAGSVRGNLEQGERSSSVLSAQSGVIRQDLANISNGSSRSPDGQADFGWSRNLKKPGRVVGFAATISKGENNNRDELSDRIGYYDQTGVALRDSLLLRLVATRNNTSNLNIGMNFSEPLKSSKAGVSRNLDFSYYFSGSHTDNVLNTGVPVMDVVNRVDSLSSSYTSVYSSHKLELSYRQSGSVLSFSAGGSATPNLLEVSYGQGMEKVSNRGINLAPVASLNYALNTKNRINVNYMGLGNAPSFDQLRPVRDARNLQLVVVGNPDLSSPFRHVVMVGFSNVEPKTGRNFSINLRGIFNRNEVVSNVLLLRDTLNGLKRELHYLNANGSYELGPGYTFSLPLAKNKYQLNFQGSVDYRNNISYTDNQQVFSRGLSFLQVAGLRFNVDRISLNANASYANVLNSYTLGAGSRSRIQTWSFDGDARSNVAKVFISGLSLSYRINEGYLVNPGNPFIINVYVEKFVFKKKVGSIRLQAFDVLDQQIAVNRIYNATSITESTTNRIGRYFLLTLMMRFSHFGGSKN